MKVSLSKIVEVFLVSLFLIFLCIIFFWKIVFLGKTLLAADVLREWYPWRAFCPSFQPAHNSNLGESILHFYPLCSFIAKVFHSKALPLWNPYILCGTPFLAANEPLVLHPFNLFYLFSPLHKAIDYTNILKIFLAGLFMYLFLRELKLCKSASIVGSIVFMFSGFFITWMARIDGTSGGIWLPLILLCFELMFKRSRLFYAFLAGVVLSMSVLSGFIQITIYVWLGSALYVIIKVIQLEKNKLKYFIFSATAFLVGLGLSALQILPTAEFLSLSQRLVFPYQFHLLDLRVLRHLVTLVIPDFFGTPVERNYWGLNNYVELCGYIGIFPLALLCLTFLKRKDSRLYVFWFIAAISLLIYLKTPLEALLYFIPGYCRGAETQTQRIVFLYTFCAAALAGFGFDFLVNTEYREAVIKWYIKIIFAFLIVVGLFSLIFYIFLKTHKEDIILQSQKINYPVITGFNFTSPTFLEIISQSYERFLAYYHPFSHMILVPLIIISITLVLFIFYLKNKGGFSFKLMAILLIIIDLFYFGMKFLSFSDAKLIYPSLGSIEFLKKDKDFWRAISTHGVFIPNTLMAYNIYTSDGSDMSLFSKRYVEFTSLFTEIRDPRHITIWSVNPDPPLFNLLNVKYVLTKGLLKGYKWQLVYDKDILIYENKAVLPRAFIVPKIKVIRDKESIFKELNSANFNPREYIILEEEPNVELAKQTQVDSEVIINKYSPNEVILDTRLSDNGFLFLSDTYYPGWRVYIDGAIAKVYCANYTFRAVYLKKGEHKVRFLFAPKSFKIGKAISIYTFLLLIAGLTLPLWPLQKQNSDV